MALIYGRFYSQVLEDSVELEVILPEPLNRRPDKLLYLLHGNSDDATAWQRQTSIERYAQEHRMAVALPAVRRGSAYVNQLHGDDYFTYITQEVPWILEHRLHLAPDPAHTFVAGLSMGGYGALHWALAQPERFAAVASLSGGVSRTAAAGAQALACLNDAQAMQALKQKDRARYLSAMEFRMTFGGLTGYEEQDDVHLLRQAKAAVKEGKRLPRIFMACGTEDFLYDANIALHQGLEKLGVAHTFAEGSGSHTWDFWDQWIQRAMDFMDGQ
jgi:putative tributyrin esterase